MTTINPRPLANSASDIGIDPSIAETIITDVSRSAIPYSAIKASPNSVISRPVQQSPDSGLHYEAVLCRRFAEVLSTLTLQAPSIETLEAKLKQSVDGPFNASAQGQIFIDHVQQLSRHLALLHLVHEDDISSNPPTNPADVRALAISRRALAQYANSHNTAISQTLNFIIGNVEERATNLQAPGSDALQAAVGVLKEMLEQSSKILDTVLKHINLNTVIEDLNAAHQSLSWVDKAGPIVAASIPQFLASMIHFGFIKSGVGQATNTRFPSTSAFFTRSTIVGVVTGIAHESVNAVVKPALQAFFQATSLASKTNMVALKTVDTEILIPDPLPLERDTAGGLVNKHADILAREHDLVKEQRTRFANKKALGTTTHVLGEMVPYTTFGGAQAVRQLLNDLTQIDGTTLTARALASGAAGAMSAGTQIVVQLGTIFTDDNNRTFPVYTLDHKPKDFSVELARGMDLRKPGVRTAFYSKTISGIQSAIHSGSLHPVSMPPVTAEDVDAAQCPLTSAQIIKNALLAAAGSVSYLSTLYSSQACVGETAARGAAQSSAPGMFDRTETARQNIFNPDREDLPHMSSKMALGGWPRALENATHIARGILQVPTQLLVDVTKKLDSMVVHNASISGSSPLTVAVDAPMPMRILSNTLNSATLEDETKALSQLEEGHASIGGSSGAKI